MLNGTTFYTVIARRNVEPFVQECWLTTVGDVLDHLDEDDDEWVFRIIKNTYDEHGALASEDVTVAIAQQMADRLDPHARPDERYMHPLIEAHTSFHYIPTDEEVEEIKADDDYHQWKEEAT